MVAAAAGIRDLKGENVAGDRRGVQHEEIGGPGSIPNEDRHRRRRLIRRHLVRGDRDGITCTGHGAAAGHEQRERGDEQPHDTHGTVRSAFFNTRCHMAAHPPPQGSRWMKLPRCLLPALWFTLQVWWALLWRTSLIAAPTRVSVDHPPRRRRGAVKRAPFPVIAATDHFWNPDAETSYHLTWAPNLARPGDTLVVDGCPTLALRVLPRLPLRPLAMVVTAAPPCRRCAAPLCWEQPWRRWRCPECAYVPSAEALEALADTTPVLTVSNFRRGPL